MSIKIIASVFAMQGITSSKKLVLLSLADHANDEGLSVYPSIDRTAQRTGLTSRGVRKIVKELVNDGFLIPVVKSHGYHTNEYRIDVQKLSVYADQAENTIPEPQSVYSETNPEPSSMYSEINPEPCSVNPEPGSMFSQANPEPGSIFSETNPEPHSVIPEPHSINPEPRSAESSLIIKKLKDTDAKNASMKKQNHLPFRNSLIAFFVERTGISGPPRDFKAANRLWTTPIYRIGELVDFDIIRGQTLVDLALQRLQGLTVSDPNSILKTATSIAGELKINSSARQFREEVY
jgi:hypothetical protein